MTSYQTEEEQIAAIKRWWEANGKFVIIAGIVIVATVIGTRAWQNFQLSALAKASAQYDLMLRELEAGETDTVLQRSEDIMKSRADSRYAILSALLAAKVEVAKDNLEGALAKLNLAMSQAKSDKLKHIIRIRLARVLMAQGKLDEALTYATFPEQGRFNAQYSIVQGDIYVKKGELGSAKTAYTLALNSGLLGAQLKSFVQVKLDDLGASGSGE